MKYLKQMIADFLRKLIKLDEVIHEVERLEAEIEVVNDLANSNESELNERPTFYDTECQVEELVSDWVNDSLQDIVERLEKLEKKNEN
tara:strand:- start:152 stop:415 length:264 start_codon:yes stop_codon:yes gene_type:complete